MSLGQPHENMGLAWRLIAVLSLALLPLCLIASYLMMQAGEEARAHAEAALMDSTNRAAARESALIRTARGAAEAIGATAVSLIRDPLSCDAQLALVVAARPAYSVAAVTGPDGEVVCASSGARGRIDADLAGSTADGPRASLHLRLDAPLLGGDVLAVAVPVTENATPAGRVWLAIPGATADAALGTGRASDGAELVLFDATGEILAASAGVGAVPASLPRSRQLPDLAAEEGFVFDDARGDGDPRYFAVVPIIENQVFVLGGWDPAVALQPAPFAGQLALILPLGMWLASIVAAYFGMHRLVIRHVRQLRRWMREHTAGREDFSDARLENAPAELEEVAEAFRNMTALLSAQSRDREQDLKEKTTLLREVHHRVKNNLQLISSVLNMQGRAASSREARSALSAVQDRVMALATVHRHLYKAQNLSMLRTDELLDGIIGQLIVVEKDGAIGTRIQVSTHFQSLEVSPDQSVPLSLLATEVARNAVKYCSAPAGDEPWINIVLHETNDGRIAFSAVNSRTGRLSPGDADVRKRAGLGSSLIEAFAEQLHGTLEINYPPDRFELHVVFSPDSVSGDGILAELAPEAQPATG